MFGKINNDAYMYVDNFQPVAHISCTNNVYTLYFYVETGTSWFLRLHYTYINHPFTNPNIKIIEVEKFI